MSQTSILSGLKVLDLASFLAGPTAATMLGDFGADVIKVEPPQGGDFYRTLSFTPGMPPCDDNFCWMLTSRNKRSIALDLKSDEAYEALIRLAKDADIIIVNYPLQVRERLKLRYEDFAPLNDRLIYASMTGFGEKGREVNNPGFDVTAFWARTGLMEVVRSKGSPPGMLAPGMGDHPTAMSLFSAILLALLQRERTGKGTKVSSSLLATGVWANGILLQAILCGGGACSPPGPLNPINAMTNLYETKEKRWFLLGAVNEDKCWPIVLTLISREDLAQDSRFVDTPARRKNSHDLAAIFREEFLKQDITHWINAFHGSGVTLSPVSSLEDSLHDQQMRDSGAIVPYTTPDGREIETIDSPIWVDGIDKIPAGPAPELGEHTDDILRSVGYSEDDISAMRTNGSIG